MAEAIEKGERTPLPAQLYNFVQKVATHGIMTRYVPHRAAALGWDQLEDLRILEVGCGPGSVPSRGVATDLDASRVRYVTKQGLPGVVADGRQMPFVNGCFSVVYCEGVLHHIDDAGAIAWVTEMLRVCRPHGHVMVMDSVWPKSLLRTPAWVIRWADLG